MTEHLSQFIEPHRVVMGYIGTDRVPIYANCAGCGETDAVLTGAIIGDDHRVCVIPVDGGPFVNPAYFCAACWEELKGANDR